MSITLNATLKTAQDGNNHRPIVEIISSPVGEIIPVLGNYFNVLTTEEKNPSLTELSTGRMASLMVRGGSLYYLYTDTEKTQWSEQFLIGSILNCTLCELTNGNVGIILITTGSHLRYMIVSPTGTIVTNSTLIYDASGNWIDNPYVLTLQNDTYLLVYPEGTDEPPSESNTYYLKQRTSSSFTSWGSATDITPNAFASVRYCNNPHLTQITSGRIFLHLDYLTHFQSDIEVNNIYYMTSDNNGSSWSDATAVTNYSELGTKATHPSVIEKDNGDLLYIFTDGTSVKQLTTSMAGYPSAEGFDPRQLHFDPNTRRLYVYCSLTFYDTFQNIVTIDADDWEYIKRHNTSTLPAFPEIPTPDFRNAGKWCAYAGSYDLIMVLNTETDVIKWYKSTAASGGYSPNYTVPRECPYDIPVVMRSGVVVIDGSNERLYMHGGCAYFGTQWDVVGYIDLNENADPVTGKYTFTEVRADYNYLTTHYLQGAVQNVYWIESLSYLMFCTSMESSPEPPKNKTGIWVINPATGGCVHNINGTTVAQFPEKGARAAVYVNGYFYFTFPYSGNQPDKRGLGRYNPTDNSVIYYQPTWLTTNDYYLHNLIDMGDGRLLMTCNYTFPNGGIVIYDTSTGVWTLFNDENYPGMLLPDDDGNRWGTTNRAKNALAYDSVTNTIYAAYGGYWGQDSPVLISLSEYGAYSILKYGDVLTPDSTPSYGSLTIFSYDSFESQAIIVYDSDYILWAVWRHLEAGSEYSIKWANLLDDLDLTNDIAINDAIEIEWDVKKIAQLKFSLARGHLYDPQNLMSIISPFVKKGRKFVVRMGERISSNNYWQIQGEYLSKELKLSYKTGEYPTIKIVAEDLRTLWDNNEIVATTYYNGESQHNTMEHLLLNFADLESSEMDISAFTGGHSLYHQWVHMTLADIIEMLLDHYSFFGYVNMSGKFEPRKVDFSESVDHAYTGVKIIEFTPNESYSTYVNRITVKGMANSFTEVLYGEESLTSISGTTGWWGKNTKETVWYSDDHHRTCRNPRLEVIQSVTEFKSFLDAFSSGGNEYIYSVDTDEHYVIIKIEAPNLMGAFIGAVLALIATGAAAIGCDQPSGGWCGPMIYACSVASSIVLNILGAVASYSYNIWGRPIGHEKQTFQASANDEALQKELGGKIITEIIDDPLCYTIGSCQSVADYEISITSAQRRRLEFTKPTHLQDEIGDIITIIHPQSEETVKMFAINIKRSMKIGKHWTDKIQGWRLLE